MIQGSQDWQDWLGGLFVFKTDWFGARVHSGFASQARKLSMLGPFKFYVGHSLGGAIAQCLAHALGGRYYSFGAPRCGHGLKGKGIAVSGRGDKICHYPWKIFGYEDPADVIRVGTRDHWWSFNDHTDYIVELERE